jgi:ABC-type multidrug transport system ATPase subunit
MGPSGAGKSTLMDILAVRKTVGTLSGQLLVNGQPAGKSYICSSSYIPQVGIWVPQRRAQG